MATKPKWENGKMGKRDEQDVQSSELEAA